MISGILFITRRIGLVKAMEDSAGMVSQVFTFVETRKTAYLYNKALPKDWLFKGKKQ